MKDVKQLKLIKDLRMSNFSQIISIIFVTVVVIGSMIKILFF